MVKVLLYVALALLLLYVFSFVFAKVLLWWKNKELKRRVDAFVAQATVPVPTWLQVSESQPKRLSSENYPRSTA